MEKNRSSKKKVKKFESKQKYRMYSRSQNAKIVEKAGPEAWREQGNKGWENKLTQMQAEPYLWREIIFLNCQERWFLTHWVTHAACQLPRVTICRLHAS